MDLIIPDIPSSVQLKIDIDDAIANLLLNDETLYNKVRIVTIATLYNAMRVATSL